MKGKKRKTEKERLISAQRIVKRVLVLSAAYLMEEQDWDDDKLIEYYDAICRWSDALDSHLITIHKVIDMINEKTGAEIKW